MSTATPIGSEFRQPGQGWSDNKELEQIWRILGNITSGDASRLRVDVSGAGIIITPIEQSSPPQRRQAVPSVEYDGPYKVSIDPEDSANIIVSNLDIDPILNNEATAVVTSEESTERYFTPEDDDISIIYGNFFFYNYPTLTSYRLTIDDSAVIGGSSVPIIQSERMFHALPNVAVALARVTKADGIVTKVEQLNYGVPNLWLPRRSLRYAESVNRLYLTYHNFARPLEIYLEITPPVSSQYVVLNTTSFDGTLELFAAPPTGVPYLVVGMISINDDGELTRLTDWTSIPCAFDKIRNDPET